MTGGEGIRVLLAVILVGGTVATNLALARDGEQDRCAGSRDVVVYNGKIITEDANDPLFRRCGSRRAVSPRSARARSLTAGIAPGRLMFTDAP
jgi:hypothetical protein